MAEIPGDRKYTKEHEWAVLKDGVVEIGITDYAQGELGDIVFVEMPESGKKLGKGDVFGTIEAVKTVAELFSPVNGTVSAVNSEVEGDSSLVNSDCYGKGWLVRVTPDSENELDDLMDAAAYQELIQ